METKGLMIAAVNSGAGKTTISLGIMAALIRKGIAVQPFKVGPDYIDTGLHFAACGRRSHNLDSWMGSEEIVKRVFYKNARKADISVIEGVMGLYDGAKGSGIAGSSAHVALTLNLPVILVVDVRGMARSCLALVKGFLEYEPQLNLKGIILNYASGDYYKTYLKTEIEDELGVKVLGCLPKHNDIQIPSRHLGLLPNEENDQLDQLISKMADLIEQEIDVAELIELAENLAAIEMEDKELRAPSKVRIGVARDAGFSFYYQDSLDYLEELGGEIHFFSPLHDQELPEVHGLYIGGGFPEMFLSRLSQNESMKDSVREAHKNGMPIWAECGGFMYLNEEIAGFTGETYSGVGIIPGQVKMSGSLAALGYVQAKALKDSIIAERGDVLRGHEFHYSIINGIDHSAAFTLMGGKGKDFRPDGYVAGNLAASYVHLHLRSNPGVARNLLKACEKYKLAKSELQTCEEVSI
ncbi:cobyrinic acid a,c-diamide synthase [hydrocarbon metagenome]|uniref:Cobyrinic acid a,c-diamide synthase n=1 Tax=hydrocarbon metagenome TaxID=938273 RepID=A0A0W8EA34_9ZZZZ